MKSNFNLESRLPEMVTYHMFLCKKLPMYTSNSHQIILLTTVAMLKPSNRFRQLNGTLVTI